MSRQSLAARASMALLLTIGFYLLALAIAGGLLFFVYAELRWADRILVRATIFAVVGAGVILWSIVPRWDRFKAPAPRLERPRIRSFSSYCRTWRARAPESHATARL